VWDVQQGVAMILAQIARGQLPDPRAYRPDLPESFSVWFQKALHPDLNQRFQSARTFIESLEEALTSEGEPISSIDPGGMPSSYNAPIPDPASASSFAPPPDPGQAEARDAGRAIAWLTVLTVCVLSGYTFWLYVLHPTATAMSAGASENLRGAASADEASSPIEQGPGAELINRAQQQFRNDQHEAALATLEQALGESPTIAQSLIRHANIASDDVGRCRFAGLGRPRPFSVDAPASHAVISYGPHGILAMWTDTHQDPKRRNVYSAVLDESLRRTSPVRNVTPEATTAIYPTLIPLPEGYATVYWDSDQAQPGVYVRAIEADGRIRTPTRLISEEKRDKYFPAVTLLPGGDLLGIWSEKSSPSGRSSLILRRLNRELKPNGDPVPLTALSSGDATQPFAKVFGDHLFIAYRYLIPRKTSEIRLLRIPLASPALVSGIEGIPGEDRWAGDSITLRTHPRQAEPALTCNESGCIVVWDDEAGGAYAGYVPANEKSALWHRNFDSQGSRPTIAQSQHGDVAIAYFAGDRLLLAPVNRDGVGQPSVISRVSGFQPAPTLVPGQSPGEWLLAWRDFEAGHLEVFVARAHCSPAEE
jgi:serine/threonine-protein kinase